MKIFNLLAFLCCFLSLNIYATEALKSKARLSLKNYGFTKCITSQFEQQSAIKKDFNSASRAYHFMGKGLHMILQNEDTFDVLHNPYKEVQVFVKSAMKTNSSISKYTNANIVSVQCLSIYNSKEYDKFIRTQDAYIR